MTDEREDAGLVSTAKDGDVEAFAVLVARYQEAAFRCAWLHLRNAAEAEDVAQEAFIRAHRGLRQFRTGEPFRPWLLRIVTNLARNELRANGRRGNRLLAFWSRGEPRSSPPPEEGIAATEGQQRLWAAVRELREEDRNVLYLRYFLDLPEREMAAVLAIAPGTVKSRLSRASARLRLVIEDHYPDLAPGRGSA